MTYYNAAISTIDGENNDVLNFNVEAGPITLSVELRWPIDIQEEYNAYLEIKDLMAKSDTIEGDGTYDYLKYYLSIGDDIPAWIARQTSFPASLKELPSKTGELLDSWISRIQERIGECQALQSVLDFYKEQLQWQFIIRQGDYSETGLLTPGSIHTLINGVTVEVSITKDDDSFNRMNLAHLSLRIGVPDDIG